LSKSFATAAQLGGSKIFSLLGLTTTSNMFLKLLGEQAKKFNRVWNLIA